ncbi:hypothetical protein [Erythrobacter litoralis]|uniref:hypothetical protein n=1 Tax=Erythrobacter litoralis TaxID=39960 RepID=UPI0006741F50|nr:hypothetical protein [Erythrobacter litoralis]
MALSACASAGPPAPPTAVGPLGEPYVYSQQVDAGGIPIRSSARVSDGALEAAKDMVEAMLAFRPDLRDHLVSAGYRVSIIAEEEALLDLPDFGDWKRPDRDDPRLTRCERKLYEVRIGSLTDRAYWNARARGIGGVHTVGSEEDVLGMPSSRYYGETIFVHEFAHNVLFAIEAVDPALFAGVEAAYAAALAEGRWLNEYATTTVQEYWAEGTQFWFDSNRLVVVDGRRILNHQDLADYDPALYAALSKAYGTNHWLESDPFYLSEARVPPGPIPKNTAEVC